MIEFLKLHPDIEKLILYRNNIDGPALETLIPALLELHNLKTINLGYNSINDVSIEKLSPLVNQGTLKRLILSVNTGITDKSLGFINSWRKSGLLVETFHTRISPQFIINGIEEERVFECSM